jgi:hypothetical protein
VGTQKGEVMKHKLNARILSAAFVALSLTGATAFAQHEHHGGQKPSQSGQKQEQHKGHDAGQGMAGMMAEPHHLLAMAHHESMAAFARALNRHTAGTGTLNAEFARNAVAEIRRNFDQMARHHHDHMQTMSGAARTQMDAMMKQMEPHHAKMREHLEALERETGGAQPDRQRVATHAAEFVKHLDEMSKMHGGHAGHHK